jgi:transmembrane sensor
MKMESRIAQLNKIAPRRIRVQAALWVTDLHGPGRDAALEARVRHWIAEDPRHAAAFELATEAWQRSGNLPGNLPKSAPHSVADRSRPRISGRALAGMTILCAAFVSAVYFLHDGTLTTGPAEQRTVELSDGTQVSLNANSRVVVQYDDRVRKVTLTSGEALFNVTKHQPRPFVVVIGDRKVIAMGTSFLVRREEPAGSAFAVTLVEGRVAIEPISWPDVLPSNTVTGLNLLNPGERLRFASAATEVKDSPSIDKVTAWQRGQLIFDDTSLNEAAAEFNRYGTNKIAIDGPAVGKLRVGGVFRIGDPVSFAQAMVSAYHLRIINRGKTIVLTDRTIGLEEKHISN